MIVQYLNHERFATCLIINICYVHNTKHIIIKVGFHHSPQDVKCYVGPGREKDLQSVSFTFI